MAGVNLPITSPLWIAQRVVEDLEVSSERNPKEEVAHVENEKINSSSPKIAKVAEKDLEGLSQMHKVKHQFYKNLIGGTNELTMDDMRGTENSSQTVHINQGSDLPMTDTAGTQGFMCHSWIQLQCFLRFLTRLLIAFLCWHITVICVKKVNYGKPC